MVAKKTGFGTAQLIRIPLILLTLFVLLIIGKSSLNLISAFAIPFGFSSGTTTALTTIAVIFFLSIGVPISLYIFKNNDSH